jgi:hypothetical protein
MFGFVARDLLGLTHHLDLPDIEKNPADADDIIGMIPDFLDESFKIRKIEKCTGCFEVGLDHYETEGAMKHAKRETSLSARHLILIQFHRVDFTAAVFILLSVRPENASQQDTSLGSKRMTGLGIHLFRLYKWLYQPYRFGRFGAAARTCRGESLVSHEGSP